MEGARVKGGAQLGLQLRAQLEDRELPHLVRTGLPRQHAVCDERPGEHGVSRSADQWIPGSSGGQSQRSTSVTTSDGARIVWASMYSMACKGFNPLQPLMEDHNMEDHTYTPHSP